MSENVNFKDTGIVKTVATGDELLIQPQYQLNAKPFTLIDLLEGINDLFKGLGGENAVQLTADTVFTQMEKFLKNINKDKIQISIQQVFLHVTKPAQGDTSLEYAFSLKIDMSDGAEPKDLTFAELQSVSFGIWNTKNQKILSTMKLASIAQQLG